MLFPQRLWQGLADGSVTLSFRRWQRPRAKVGARHHVPVGVIVIDDVRRVRAGDISDADARRAGAADREALLADLGVDGDAQLYRVAFTFAGPDPRRALAADDDLDEAAVAALRERLARLDARSSHGPWTTAVLRLVAARPATRAADLAAELGRDTPSFKRDVRKLKALGLTESLEVGYRLSPRGRALLDAEG